MSRVTWVANPGSLKPFAYWTNTIYGRTFQTVRLGFRLVTSRWDRTPIQLTPATLDIQRIRAITYTQFRLFPVRSPLLGKSRLLSLPQGTKMFQFPWFASIPYVFRNRCWEFIPAGFPIRAPPDLSLFAAPRGLSQLVTPFIVY